MVRAVIILLIVFLHFPLALAKEFGVIHHGDSERHVVALTFDDGPKPEFSQRILSILDLYGVKATFFIVGKVAEEHPDEVFRMHDSGHEVGNHTYSHPDLLRLNLNEVRKELRKTNNIVYEITGKYPKFFRAPGGLYNDRILKIITDEEMFLVKWDVNASDYDAESFVFEIDKDYNALAKDLVERVTKKAKNGSIILFHNGAPQTVKALPAIIENLREKGFGFVTVSELLNPDENW